MAGFLVLGMGVLGVLGALGSSRKGNNDQDQGSTGFVSGLAQIW